MELIPAIDLLGGKVVRLERGDYERVTVYSDDPAGMARSFEDAGATRLHVVDLDGARDGRAGNTEAIAAILERTSLAVQIGGGLRTREDVTRWLERSVSRVVLGTAAIKNPQLVEEVCRRFPEQIIVAIDARGGRVAVEGWTETSNVEASDLARRAEAFGASALLYTNIERDGTRIGPDVEGTVALQAETSIDVIASGGIGNMDHLRALADAKIRSTVCGRALYSGAIDLRAAYSALRGR